MDYKEGIRGLLNRVEDENTLKRTWKILYRAAYPDDLFSGFSDKERRIMELASALGEHKAKAEQEAEEKKGA